MLKKWGIFLFVFTQVINGWCIESINLDSLKDVILKSTNRQDFFYADSIIEANKSTYNSSEQMRLIYVASNRAQELNFELYAGKFILRESIIETIQGNFGKAFKLAQDALRKLSKYNVIEIVSCYNTIAGMVAYFGDTEGAIEYMKKADEICELFQHDPMYKENYCNNQLMWGNIYLSSGNLLLGEQHILNSLEIARDEQLTIAEIYSRLNLSKLAILQEDYQRSFDNLDIALEQSKAHKIYNLEAITDMKIAQTYEAMGKYNAAILQYHQAEKLAIEQELGDRLLTIYKALSRLYKRNGVLSLAYEYQQRYIDAYVIQKSNEKKEQLELLQVRFKMSERDAMIVNLALDKANEEAEKDILQLIIFITVATVIILTLIILLIYNRNRLKRKIESEQLERAVATFQLTALKSQMNPHFIFNALNSIQDLILKGNAEESYRYINMFADLVRKTLNHSNQEFIDIEDEFASISVYLDLEQLRFKDEIKISLITNNIRDIEIPPLLIQPFIENSIKHGLLHKTGSKELSIKFELKADLVCTITDNGVGRKQSEIIKSRRGIKHPSFATESITGRFDILKSIYGNHVGVTYKDLYEGEIALGTTVLLNLPFRPKY